ncbi:MAG: hypothetical protein RLY32_1651 [Pseudomonadota bacterium]
MRAMILAAGRGERMRPLTDEIPKALVRVAGEPLIHRHLRALASAGIREVVINHAWLGEQLVSSIGNGAAWDLHVQWSAEAQALETAGGIAKALALLGKEPFLVVNADIVCDFRFQDAFDFAAQLGLGDEPLNAALAFSLLVDNPDHHPAGDFEFEGQRLTFSGIGVYRPELFAGIEVGQSAKLGPLLKDAMAKGRWRAKHHQGYWCDVGTPERLAEAESWLAGHSKTPSHPPPGSSDTRR